MEPGDAAVHGVTGGLGFAVVVGAAAPEKVGVYGRVSGEEHPAGFGGFGVMGISVAAKGFGNGVAPLAAGILPFAAERRLIAVGDVADDVGGAAGGAVVHEDAAAVPCRVIPAEFRRNFPSEIFRVRGVDDHGVLVGAGGGFTVRGIPEKEGQDRDGQQRQEHCGGGCVFFHKSSSLTGIRSSRPQPAATVSPARAPEKV